MKEPDAPSRAEGMQICSSFDTPQPTPDAMDVDHRLEARPTSPMDTSSTPPPTAAVDPPRSNVDHVVRASRLLAMHEAQRGLRRATVEHDPVLAGLLRAERPRLLGGLMCYLWERSRMTLSQSADLYKAYFASLECAKIHVLRTRNLAFDLRAVSVSSLELCVNLCLCYCVDASKLVDGPYKEKTRKAVRQTTTAAFTNCSCDPTGYVTPFDLFVHAACDGRVPSRSHASSEMFGMYLLFLASLSSAYDDLDPLLLATAVTVIAAAKTNPDPSLARFTRCMRAGDGELMVAAADHVRDACWREQEKLDASHPLFVYFVERINGSVFMRLKKSLREPLSPPPRR